MHGRGLGPLIGVYAAVAVRCVQRLGADVVGAPHTWHIHYTDKVHGVR